MFSSMNTTSTNMTQIGTPETVISYSLTIYSIFGWKPTGSSEGTRIGKLMVQDGLEIPGCSHDDSCCRWSPQDVPAHRIRFIPKTWCSYDFVNVWTTGMLEHSVHCPDATRLICHHTWREWQDNVAPILKNCPSLGTVGLLARILGLESDFILAMRPYRR
jgi:hypothetical protein